MARDYVLDSYALLAYLEAEPGGDRVQELLEAAMEGKCRLYLCVVNLGEVMYIVERGRGLPKAQEALARIDELPVEVVDVNLTLTLAAAHLKAQWPLAYADCFAAALSQAKDAPLVTGDPEFGKVAPGSTLKLEWLPKREGRRRGARPSGWTGRPIQLTRREGSRLKDGTLNVQTQAET